MMNKKIINTVIALGITEVILWVLLIAIGVMQIMAGSEQAYGITLSILAACLVIVCLLTSRLKRTHEFRYLSFQIRFKVQEFFRNK